jgi:D-hydroxyproline dehydrogenase subunit gamma
MNSPPRHFRRVASRPSTPMAESMVAVFIDDERVLVPAFTTVAAALAAQGKLASRRSVSGERRNVLCGMGVCQECRVTVDGRAHTLGCQTLCRDGVRIETAS